jgi:CheY-like chemotaxis protein
MKRVLIVDDAIDLGRLLQDALKVTHPDIPITVVPSAEEALLESTRFTFDLLITDLRLPGMSGVELIRKIRIRQPEIKVILITALMPEDRLVRQKDEVHPDIFIRKPLSIFTFLDAVDSLIGKDDVLEETAQAETPGPPMAVDADGASQVVEAPVVDTGPVEPPSAQEADYAGKTGVSMAETGMPSEEPAQLEEDLAQAQDLLSDLAAAFGPKTETRGPVSQAAVPEPEAACPSTPGLSLEQISATLIQLKNSLGASVVLFATDRGEIAAQEGNLPDAQLINQLVPAALASLSASTAVSRLLGRAPVRSVQAFQGTSFHLVLAPLAGGGLVVVLPAGRSALRLAIAFEEALGVQEGEPAGSPGLSPIEFQPGSGMESQGLYSIEQLGVTRSLSEKELGEDVDQGLLPDDRDLEKLDALVTGGLSGDAGREDADSFWETAAVRDGKDKSTPGFPE